MSNTFQEEFERRNNKARAVVIAGYPCKIKRPSLNAWIIAGLVPQDLVNELAQQSPSDDSMTEADEAAAIAAGRRLQQLKIELCVTTSEGEPFSFTREPGKICILDLEDPDRFLNEVLRLINDLPISTASGEVSADALATFRQDEDRQAEPSGPSVHSSQVWSETVHAHRHIG